MSDEEKIAQLKKQIESETEAEKAVRMAKASEDPDRPKYHFQPPPGWMNDPNGPIFWKGRYHVFYQYNPDRPYWANMHWGHAVSDDMIHWQHLPIALAPTPGGPDKGGCYTGCAVDNNGVPTIVYTGVRPEVQCIAIGSDDMITWRKHEANPVIAAPPEGMAVTGFRDPCAWKEGDTWYVIIGSGIKDVGGTSLLYKSPDLIHWEYMHPLYECDPTHKMNECPDFFPLGDRYALITSPYDGTHWSIGTYADHKFAPETHGKVDYGHYYAAKTMADDRGRRIIWGWIRESRPMLEQIEAGWSGAMSLPRILTVLPDNTLGIEPAAELETLRGRHWSFQNVGVDESNVVKFSGIGGNSVEILARFAGGEAEEFGVVVQGTETISYSPEKQQIAGAPLELRDGEELALRIYVDRSITEVFANGRVCRTIRNYHAANDEVRFFARGGRAKVVSADIWKMNP